MAAKKSRTFGPGNKGSKGKGKSARRAVVWGRPRSYDDPKEFEAKCQRYFKSLKWFNKPNIAGLCLFLGIARDTWYDYKKKRKDFSDTIRAVESAIETAWVDKLGSSYATGAIFYLKNFRPQHWKDRLSGDPDEPINVKITGMRIIREK